MPLDPAFVADCPYGPDALFIDEILEVDKQNSRIVARWNTTGELPLTNSQRVHPVLHPRHINGGLMLHVTGMVGFAHAYYVLGLRHHEGWTGYASRIHSARFMTLTPPGDPIDVEVVGHRMRIGDLRVMGRYQIRAHQNGKLVYRGDQGAIFMKLDPSQTTPAPSGLPSASLP